MMDIKEIMKHIPHRFPFLLVDRVLEIKKDESLVALKNVTINENFFQGHFPASPIMPGVLIIEGLAQAAGVLAVVSKGSENSLIYFMSIEKAKFRKPVVPGDQMRYEVHVVQHRQQIWKMAGKALVDGAVVAEAEFMAMMTEKVIA